MHPIWWLLLGVAFVIIGVWFLRDDIKTKAKTPELFDPVNRFRTYVLIFIGALCILRALFF